MRLFLLLAVIFVVGCSYEEPCSILQTVEIPGSGLLSVPGIDSYSPYSSDDKVATTDSFGVYALSEEVVNNVSVSYSGDSLRIKSGDTSSGWISIRKDFGGFVDLSAYSGIRFKVSLADSNKNYYQVRVSFGDICGDDPEKFTLFPKSENCDCSSPGYYSWDYEDTDALWSFKLFQPVKDTVIEVCFDSLGKGVARSCYEDKIDLAHITSLEFGFVPMTKSLYSGSLVSIGRTNTNKEEIDITFSNFELYRR